MNLKEIVIDGKVYDFVSREESTPKSKKTGYERAEEGNDYFCENIYYGMVNKSGDGRYQCDDVIFKNAGYYTDKKLAKDNIRADRLLRRLRRFSAVNREDKIDWENTDQTKFGIVFGYNGEGFSVSKRYIFRNFGGIWFDTEELARKAIEEFRDDLMWYFTEYKDIAEGSAEDDD